MAVDGLDYEGTVVGQGVGPLGDTEGAPGIEWIGRQSIDDAGGLGPLCAAHIPTLSRGSPIPPIPQG